MPSGTGLARQKLSVVGRVRLIGDGANSLFKAEHSSHQERSVQLSETDDDDDIARFYSRDEHKTSHHVILCSMNIHDTYFHIALAHFPIQTFFEINKIMTVFSVITRNFQNLHICPLSQTLSFSGKNQQRPSCWKEGNSRNSQKKRTTPPAILIMTS